MGAKALASSRMPMLPKGFLPRFKYSMLVLFMIMARCLMPMWISFRAMLRSMMVLLVVSPAERI